MVQDLKISIVTSVRNGDPFLCEALASVANQTYQNWEHIIIDAGSTDGSFELAKKASDIDNRCRVFHHPGESLYASLEWGLRQAEGDFVAWLNADDLYAPWAFASLVDYLHNNGAQWVTGLPACWDAEGRLRFVRPQAWFPKEWIAKGYFHLDGLGFLQQETMFFSKALFASLSDDERTLFKTQKLAGDFALWKMFAERSNLSVLPTVLGGFRRHQANMSSMNMEAYMQEARAVGARSLPFPGRVFYRRLYDMVGAFKQLSAVGHHDRRLAESLV